MKGGPPDHFRALPPIEENPPHQGMAQPGEMDPDLVGPSGLQLQAEQGIVPARRTVSYQVRAGFPSSGHTAPPASHPGGPEGHPPSLWQAPAHPRTPPGRSGGNQPYAAAPSGPPGRGDDGPQPSGRRSPDPDGGPGGNPPPRPSSRNNTEENYLSYRHNAPVRGGLPPQGPCSAPEGPGPHRRCPADRGRARCRCAAPGRTDGRTAPPRPGNISGIHPPPIHQDAIGQPPHWVMKGEAITAGSMPIFPPPWGECSPPPWRTAR